MDFDFFDEIGDFFSEVSNEFKDFCSDMEEVREGVGGAVAEFGADLKNAVKEFKEDFAYEIDPDLGEFVEKEQKVEDTIENIINSPGNLTLVGKRTDGKFQLADHLFVRRGIYTHHAIYIGDGEVMHYSPMYDGDMDAVIHRASVEEFADGDEIYRLGRDKSPLIYSPEEAVGRAESREGEDGYNLFGNNCEQFVRWCRCGR